MGASVASCDTGVDAEAVVVRTRLTAPRQLSLGRYRRHRLLLSVVDAPTGIHVKRAACWQCFHHFAPLLLLYVQYHYERPYDVHGDRYIYIYILVYTGIYYSQQGIIRSINNACMYVHLNLYILDLSLHRYLLLFVFVSGTFYCKHVWNWLQFQFSFSTQKWKQHGTKVTEKTAPPSVVCHDGTHAFIIITPCVSPVVIVEPQIHSAV